jgi:hypothetical protein
MDRDQDFLELMNVPHPIEEANSETIDHSLSSHSTNNRFLSKLYRPAQSRTAGGYFMGNSGSQYVG